MEIGFFFWPYNVALVRGMAEAADRFGYDMVGIADTPGNAMDPGWRRRSWPRRRAARGSPSA